MKINPVDLKKIGELNLIIKNVSFIPYNKLW